MIHLVDTSGWIEVFRADGREDVKARVGQLIADGNVRWCEMVLVELWNGTGEQDARRIKSLQKLVPTLAIDSDVWNVAIGLTQIARSRGITVQATDLLIAACAKRYGVRLLSRDRHFDYLATL